MNIVSAQSSAETRVSAQYPLEYHWESRRYCESEFDEVPMRFKLIYEGPLLASSDHRSRSSNKHRIRKEIHKQLAELWKVQYPLTMISNSWGHVRDESKGANRKQTKVEEIAERHTKLGFRFVPLIERTNGLVCRLDILFLRRSSPGEIVRHGGDLDNRIKTLFDALKIPETLGDEEIPEDGEDPFYCLLEDDALITEVNVSTDRLLTVNPVPTDSTKPENDVHLIIGVETMIANPQLAANALWLYG